jgi:peptidyl-prolyl cis-trans isomerase A (cyclophilin A)
MTTPRRSLLALIAGLFAAPKLAFAQTSISTFQNMMWPLPGPTPAPRVKITTEKGDIYVEVYPDRAPLTAGLFLRMVKEKRYDKPAFYRVVKLGAAPGPVGGMLQGGDSGTAARRLPPIAHESTTQTGLHHFDSALSMPRFERGTARGEFFICVGNLSDLDAQAEKPGEDTFGFAVFGRVIQGMDVVKAMLELKPSATAGPAGMRGEILDPPSPITLEAL